jgi:hypothetical protein
LIEPERGYRVVPVRDGRPFSRSPDSVIQTNGGAFRRLTTIGNDVQSALVDEPRAQLSECATPVFKVTQYRIPPEQVGTKQGEQEGDEDDPLSSWLMSANLERS